MRGLRLCFRPPGVSVRMGCQLLSAVISACVCVADSENTGALQNTSTNTWRTNGCPVSVKHKVRGVGISIVADRKLVYTVHFQQAQILVHNAALWLPDDGKVCHVRNR